MRFLFLSIITILMTNLSNAQNKFDLRKDHDAILVQDVDRSAKFYEEILGLKEIPNGGLGDHIRWFALGDNVQIHLIESTDETEKHKGVHFALNTADLKGLMEFLNSANIAFENWPGEKGVTNTRPDGIKQIYLQDPDGYWIEINDSRF
ncbi:VOC family protein [Christiangramia salexigens]|uniref:Glyoxalase n=1 Tax=Christiangramia salexigens TaxID=1913577 RepID=A0A1L3J7F5_9FLAO|nr:VOC family protein [Christiangramia salexigens]APG61041.1 glyoxalase [Christiangramia salexigens]